MDIDTAARKSNLSYMLEIDNFLDTDFDASCDKSVAMARRMQIERYIEELEGVQIIEPTQHTRNILSRHTVISRLCALKHHLNLLAPISRLPIEIIHSILYFRVEHFRKPFRVSIMGDSTFPIDSLGWIKVTHVCRAWRTIILQDPSLWTYITPQQSTWAIEMISRSRNTLLSVAADHFRSSPKHIRTTNVILQQMYRIRELSLNIPEPSVLEKELMQPAPALESFAIRVIRPCAFPDSLFQGMVPMLRHLSLNNCQISWNSPIFHGLTALRLIKLTLTISMSQFLDVFRDMPNLESLKVEFQGTTNRDETLVFAPLVVLSRLSTLNIGGMSYLCHLFLKYIRLPASPIIHGAFLLPVDHAARADPSIVIVNSFIQHLTDLDPPVRHVTIETGYALGLRVEGWTNEISTGLDPHHQRLTLRFYGSRPSQSNTWSPALKELLLGLSLRGHLRGLSLKDSEIGTPPLNGEIAPDCITLIVLHDNAGYKWLDYMVHYWTRQDMLPCLRTVVFVNAVFEDDTKTSVSQDLSNFLQSKRSPGRAIEKLELTNCKGLDHDKLAHLRSLVPEVVVNQVP